MNNKQEIDHLLNMAKLLSTQMGDGMLSYFIGMAIEQNRLTHQQKQTDKVA